MKRVRVVPSVMRVSLDKKCILYNLNFYGNKNRWQSFVYVKCENFHDWLLRFKVRMMMMKIIIAIVLILFRRISIWSI